MGSVSSEPGAQQRTGLIKQPLDLELPVVAMGARPGDQSEKRELFSEDTETVLVFENGCVIQLAAAVNVGQLVFLTNKQSGKEIVTQVLRKRSHRPTDCYVELEFTEPAPEFWGADFPEYETPPKTNAGEESDAATVAEAEVTEDDTQQSVPAPDAAEVAKLRKEVEALKSQVKSQTAPEEQTDGMQRPSSSELETLKSLLGPRTKATEPEEEEKPAAVEVPAVAQAPAAKEAKEEAIAFPFRMQLPKADESMVRSSEFAADATALAAVEAAERQLPAPSLDFERFPGVAEPKTKLFSGKATRSLSGPIGAMIAAVLFLVAAGIATVRMGWLPKFGEKGPKSDASKSAFEPASVPAPKNASAETSAINAKTNSAGDEKRGVDLVGDVKNAATSVGIPANASAPGDAATTPVKTETPIKKTEVEIPGEAPAPGNSETAAAAEKRVAKKAPAGKTAPGNPGPVVNKGEDVYVPPELVKAIKSLSPPEAIRKYVSGNVTLDALVDESGHVVAATPVSGPKTLYQRAVDTVKDYLYQPATRNGKPVPAHVEIRIQFWYEP